MHGTATQYTAVQCNIELNFDIGLVLTIETETSWWHEKNQDQKDLSTIDAAIFETAH